MTIQEIRKIAENKKNELIKNGESLDKINNIIILLKDDMCFFKIDINISIPILLYLGIPEDKVKDIYFELIDIKNFREDIKVREASDLKL